MAEILIDEAKLREELEKKQKRSQHFEHLAKTHPCMGGEAHFKYGRMHLPVSPSCNIQCKFCKREFENTASRPGVSSLLISPEEAVKAVGKAIELCPELRVVGIAGPGDTLATDYALDTFELVKKEYPRLLSCLSTNGLMLPEKAGRIAEMGIDTITVTVNAVDPEIQAKICSYIIWNGKKIDGVEGAKILIENQLKGIKAVADAGVIVKINSVLIPGINDRHIKEVARVTGELGASILNIIPLIPQNELADIPAPDCAMIERVRLEAGEYLEVFRHCKHCRADACGVPGKGQDIHDKLYDKRAVETFSHG